MELADYRKLLKKHHICRDCKKQDAYTLAGRTYCAECAQKQAEAKRNEYARDRGKKNRIACQKWKQKNEEEHKCSYCGKQLPDDCKYKTCNYCRIKMRRYNKEYRRKKGSISWEMRMSSDYCFQCAKNKPLEGKRLCKECYEKKLEISMPYFETNAEKGREIVRQELNKLFPKNV